jgi:fluoroquinolone transport system permease protein
MLNLKTLQALSAMDALSVSRDTLLRAMVIVPLALAAASRWIFPAAIERIAAYLPFDLQALYPYVIGYVLLMLAPAICGAVVGFVLLDQRDDRTLTALQVSPLPLNVYLAYRLATPMALSLAMTLVTLPLSGQVRLHALEIVLVALAASPLAPLVSLFLAAYARNKVEGFALQKGLGVVFIAPFLMPLIPAPWQYLVGLVPTYWPASLLWAVQAGDRFAWALLPAGLAYQALLIAALLRRFSRIIRQ